MLPSVLPRLATDTAGRLFPGVWKPLFLRFPSQDGAPSPPPLSLFSSFIFFPTCFWKLWSAFLGSWCPLPAFRSCFVEFTQLLNVLLMNLWGRKWSPSPIPPPSRDLNPQKNICYIDYTTTFVWITTNCEQNIIMMQILKKLMAFVSQNENQFWRLLSLKSHKSGVVLRWRRNRMGRPLSPPQIHRKNIKAPSKFHRTTSECWQRTLGNKKSRALSPKGGRTKYKR